MQDPGPAPFRIDWADDGSSHVISVHGDVDLATLPDLREAFARAVDRGAAEIVVDLAFCRFIDSSGIAALLSLNRVLARSFRRDLVVLPGPPNVQRTFALCNLLDVLPFREDAAPTAPPPLVYAPSGPGSVRSTTAR